MEKYIPFEKRSKKKQREENAARRKNWGSLNPVTRRPPNPKAYNRRKARKWIDDSSSVPFAFHFPTERCTPLPAGSQRLFRCVFHSAGRSANVQPGIDPFCHAVSPQLFRICHCYTDLFCDMMDTQFYKL